MDHDRIHTHISAVAEKQPNKVAVKQGDKTITYAELENFSDRIGATLLGCNQAQKNVVVFYENSIDLIASILGAMKAGSVFVPVDPTYPENRIRMMLEKVEAELIITKAEHLTVLEALIEGMNKRFTVIISDTNEVSTASGSITLVPLQKQANGFEKAKSGENCYIYFTSGSTNMPKAILGRHRSLKQFIDWEVKEFAIDASFVGSQLVSPSFDPYLRDVLVPLFAGGTVAIPESRAVLQNMKTLKEWIEAEHIHLIHMVPSLFKMLMEEVHTSEDFKELKYVMLAGELLRGADIKRFVELFGTRIQLVNLYGPTETTLAKMFYRIGEDDVNRLTIPIGKPIDKAQALLVDENMKQCPMGNIGEIYIRTPYISAGYYHDKELTAKVFMRNPFSDNKNDIIYKTGDKGKLLPSGDIDIVGRMDHQIKINGVRIEPSEIEFSLLQDDRIKDAVVLAKGKEGEPKYLAAYYLSDQKIESAELKSALEKSIPKAMIPAFFVPLEAFPKLPNGKLDRKSFPDPKVMMQVSTTYEAPINEVEQMLIEIWEQVLQIKGIGRQHNYFDLGGNSVNSLKVVSLINEKMGIEFSLGELFACPVLWELAENLSVESELSKLECVVRLNRVSDKKRNLFILHTIDGTVFGYRGLAKLLEEEFNVYGIQAKGLAKESILPDSIEELTSYYLYEIKKIQPEGPYLVAGHCFGIMFGYALVRLMENMGNKVDRYVVFDEQVWFDKKQIALVTAKSILTKPFKEINIRMQRRKAAKSETDLVLAYYEKQLEKNTVKKSSAGVNIQEHFRYLELNKYKFYTIINASILAFKADDTVWQRFTLKHWKRMTWGGVKIVETDGDHWTLYQEPHVKRLANGIKENL